MAWDVMSGVTKMAWDVMSGVTKTAWDVLFGVANLCGMFCPGCKKNGMGCFVPGCFVRLPAGKYLINRYCYVAIKALQSFLLFVSNKRCS